MTVLLALCALLTAVLSAYSLGHYFCAGVFLFGRAKKRTFGAGPVAEPVAILVPAMNEAERALRAITSLVQQDHGGPIEIHLLLNDRADTSLPFLKSVYPAADLDATGPDTVVLLRTTSRTVSVSFTGADPKTHKINWIVRRLTTKHVGILDADHQAEPDWVRTSLCLLQEKAARIIQGRRGPISARGFFSLWDSLHQHIGCELYNRAFTRLNLTVFFTGTTALMETQLLRDHPLTDCITEDIDFSYTLLMKGVRVIDNPHSGSHEETSPNLYSFLARRRRWSAGHTTTFFRHLREGLVAPLSASQRFHFLYHGSHYLISVLVFALHLGIGLHFVRALSTTSQVAALLAGLVLGWRIARTQRTAGAVARVSEIAVVFGWIFPAIVIAMNVAQAILINDHSRAALPIPYALQAIGLIGLCAPLIVLLVGLAGFRQLSGGSLLVVVATYPIAFYIDIGGVLLGMADSVLGQPRWRPVSRAATPPAAIRATATRLLPVRHIKESWSLGPLPGASREKTPMRLPAFARPSRLVLGSSVLALFTVGVFYEPSQTIGVAQGRCEALQQDAEPWIVPAKKLEGYCGGEQTEEGTRTGTFKPVRHDDFTATLDTKYWDRLDTTFFCNLSAFSPENARSTPGEALKLQLEHRASGGKEYSSGSIATKNADDTEFTYGRFEAVLKPAKTSGVLTAFFLYRFDPWQEIDAEFIGQDTSKLLVNVYYNPGEEGDLYNYGMFGTPVLIDLGFDASLDFHTYAIEWEKDEIRWLVDDRLVHVRRDGRPTPIPHLPMRLHASLWPNCSEKLVGPFGPANAPATAEIRSVTISNWYPSPLPQFAGRFDSLFSKDEPATDWRKKASWIQ